MRALLGIALPWKGRSLVALFGVWVAFTALCTNIALIAATGRFIAAAAIGTTVALPLSLGIFGLALPILRYLERLFAHDVSFRALTEVRVWLFCRLASGGAGGLGFRRPGTVLGRLVTDVDALNTLYPRVLLPTAGGVLLVPVVLLVIGQDSWIAASIVVGCLVLAGLVVLLAGFHTARDATDSTAQAIASLRKTTCNALSGLREIKVSGAEGMMLALVQAQETRMFRTERDFAARRALIRAVPFLAAQGALLAALLIHGANVAQAIVAIFVTIAAFEAITVMPRAGMLAGHAVASVAGLVDVATTQSCAPDPPSPAILPKATALSFDHVRFRWSGGHSLVFEDVSLQVPSMGRVAVLGPSGAGKSTLAALALKVASPESGWIRLGGTDIANLRAADVYKKMAYLSHSTHLFGDTIRNNLRLARRDADDAEIWEALEAVRVAPFVRSLPDGLDTWIGEHGIQIFGAQAMRVLLARTLLNFAPILILDEPCAGLDLVAEREFFDILCDVLGNRSLLLLGQHLVGTERLDRVWRLQGGRLMSAAG